MSFGERYDYEQYPKDRIEPNLANETNKAYSYEATKIELLAGTLANDSNTTTDPGTNNSISVAKLLKKATLSARPPLIEMPKMRTRNQAHVTTTMLLIIMQR